ncbi:hypothetical protein S40293_06716 [Stachybotrys chartarum IBT 40293]|nr:hypothetical protein S40293_06716 [Stachybotrys chartarum IBT 40293]
MFPFDPVALPQLTTRKALIVVDFQNDFLAPGGALPVSEPSGFSDRAVGLAASVREAGGDVVWVRSRFDKPRPVDEEQILATDAALVPSRGVPSRGRRRPPPETDVAGEAAEVDPEAFLSHAEPVCLRPESTGADLAPAVQDAVQKADLTLTKTHYSAFQETHLLRLLRAKMVMEVFICGSLANVGVYATALGAAGHGFSITVVEDCCGYRSESRQMFAVRSLMELTGCEVATAAEVLETIQPKKPKVSPATKPKPSSRPAASSAAGQPRNAGVSPSPDIVRPMTGLRLASDSPALADGAVPSEAEKLQKPDEDVAKVTEADRTEKKEANEERPLPGVTEDSTSERVESSATATPKDTNTAKNQVKGVQQQQKDDAAVESSAEPVTSKTAATPPPPSSPPDKPSKQGTMEEKETTAGRPRDASAPPPPQQKGLGAGDMDVIEDLLPAALEANVFEKLKDEVRWQRMSHQGGQVPRLVAVQGEVAADGTMPVYRHPSDESPPLLPFSPTVLAIKAETEKHLGHPLNHVLIQYYRDGKDYISEHCDKTLDIVRGSYIANVSLGAQRTMVLRTKKMDKNPAHAPSSPQTQPSASTAPPADSNRGGAAEPNKRRVQRARLPHNSLCRMGLDTNREWMHAIQQDKRADRDKTPAELAFGGGRISLTFRHIGTFLSADETTIWGQGATGRTREEAHAVINGQSDEAVEMLQAFGFENHSPTFDWDARYGKGFDVLHMGISSRLFVSNDSVIDLSVAFMLSEFGINYAKGSMAPPAGNAAAKSSSTESKDTAREGPVAIKYADNDADKSVVHGSLAIMLYLDTRRSFTSPSLPTSAELAERFTRFQQTLDLRDEWRRAQRHGTKLPKHALAVFDGYAAVAEYIGGSAPSLPDFVLWPVLHDVVERYGVDDALNGLDKLREYYERADKRESVRKALRRLGLVEKTTDGESQVDRLPSSDGTVKKEEGACKPTKDS